MCLRQQSHWDAYFIRSDVDGGRFVEHFCKPRRFWFWFWFLALPQVGDEKRALELMEQAAESEPGNVIVSVQQCACHSSLSPLSLSLRVFLCGRRRQRRCRLTDDKVGDVSTSGKKRSRSRSPRGVQNSTAQIQDSFIRALATI